MTDALGPDAHVAVIGGSAAGLSAAETLRRRGYAGRLTIVGAEARDPYDRPPLSKQVLRGTWEPEQIKLFNAQALACLRAEWHLGVCARSLDAEGRSVLLDDGRQVDCDGLVIATGVQPRRLPFGHELVGVHVLRTVDDALAMRARLRKARSLVVAGAGFLGAEAAAVAREMGLEVAIVDPLPAPLVRQLGPSVAGKLVSLHAAHGVNLHSGRVIVSFESAEGAVHGVVLDDGTTLKADAVLVAIGSEPAVGWLEDSGLDLTDGVVCDEFCLAAPGIVAAGDVASWPHPDHGRLRVEHRLNATEQGAAAAGTLLGDRVPFAPVPYFWTDQYDCKIQAYGRTAGELDFRVVAGDLHGQRFAALYGDGAGVVGALTWNMPKMAVTLRKSVVARSGWGLVS